MVKIWNLIRQSTLAKNIIITVFAFAMLGFITLIAVSVKPLNPLAMAVKNFSFTDIYYSILEETADPDTSMAVTIVDMTQLYRRGQLAQVLEDIQSCDPKAVGVDVAFDVEKDDFAGNDSLIALAVLNMTEKKYGKKITFDEMKKCVTVEDLFNVIAAK